MSWMALHVTVVLGVTVVVYASIFADGKPQFRQSSPPQVSIEKSAIKSR